MGIGGSSNASWGDWRRAAAAGATASGERASRWTRMSKLLLIVCVCAQSEEGLEVLVEGDYNILGRVGVMLEPLRLPGVAVCVSCGRRIHWWEGNRITSGEALGVRHGSAV